MHVRAFDTTFTIKLVWLIWHDRHCQYTEDQDPSSDYEDPLECVVCAHFCKTKSVE